MAGSKIPRSALVIHLKASMRNSTGSPIFRTSNLIFSGSFISRPRVKENKDPGTEDEKLH